MSRGPSTRIVLDAADRKRIRKLHRDLTAEGHGKSAARIIGERYGVRAITINEVLRGNDDAED